MDTIGRGGGGVQNHNRDGQHRQREVRRDTKSCTQCHSPTPGGEVGEEPAPLPELR